MEIPACVELRLSGISPIVDHHMKRQTSYNHPTLYVEVSFITLESTISHLFIDIIYIPLYFCF